MKTELSVITVTFNNEDHIRNFLEGLKKFLPDNSEIIIFDGNSEDKTKEIVEEFLSDNKNWSKKIKLLFSPDNLGFAKGMNRAAKEATGEFIFILNPDTYIRKDVFSPLIDYFKDNAEIGLIAPRLVKDSGEIQKSVRQDPNIKGLIKEYFFNKKNCYVEYIPETDTPIEIEAVYGAALLVKNTLFKQIGGFDERYFLYYEDLDLCKRIRNLGYKIIYFPGVSIYHYVGGSKDHLKSKLPIGIRTLAWFFPIKGSGRNYFQVKSRNIYHGLPKSLLISTLLYIAGRNK